MTTKLETAARAALDYLDEVAPGRSRPVGKLPSLPNIRKALRIALERLSDE